MIDLNVSVHKGYVHPEKNDALQFYLLDLISCRCSVSTQLPSKAFLSFVEPFGDFWAFFIIPHLCGLT